MTKGMADIFVGKAGDDSVFIDPGMMNRHGLIAGATGTGKTVTLRILAEELSKRGVPSVVADVKGDLSGFAKAGASHPKIEERAQLLGLDDFTYAPVPTVFWDVYADSGHPFRATVSEMGPLLLSRLLNLNSTQEAVLFIAFKVADDEGLLLLDLKDLRSLLVWLAENRKEVAKRYGGIASSSIAAIQRGLLVLEQEGGEAFLGEPVVDLSDLMRTDKDGRGIVNVLAAERLVNNPKLYATTLLWLLSELFEQLPEVGDPDKPRLVFFFDEAHLLFDDAPDVLIDKVEQVVRLIRSKGVGVYFCTQNPIDVPDAVLGQLGNRFQHALRAFTIRDQRAVKAAAETFRANPAFDTAEAITQLGVGEALVSTLEDKGVPTVVARTLIRPPESLLGPITKKERAAVIRASGVGPRYDKTVDRESAYEMLAKRTEENMGAEEDAPEPPKPRKAKSGGILDDIFSYGYGGGRRQSVGEAMIKSAARSIGSSVGRSIARGLLGGIFKG